MQPTQVFVHFALSVTIVLTKISDCPVRDRDRDYLAEAGTRGATAEFNQRVVLAALREHLDGVLQPDLRAPTQLAMPTVNRAVACLKTQGLVEEDLAVGIVSMTNMLDARLAPDTAMLTSGGVPGRNP